MVRPKYWLSEFYTDLDEIRKLLGDDEIDNLCAYISTEEHEACICVWGTNIKVLSDRVVDMLYQLNTRKIS